jgi:hypothetical protein
MGAEKPRCIRARLVVASKRAQGNDASLRPLLGQRPAGKATLLRVDGRKRAIGMAVPKIRDRAPKSASLVVQRPIRQGGGSIRGRRPRAGVRGSRGRYRARSGE